MNTAPAGDVRAFAQPAAADNPAIIENEARATPAAALRALSICLICPRFEPSFFGTE
jgi:hypothetical protein